MNNQINSTSVVRYTAIDGLRWYAAFLVFLVHYCGSVVIEVMGVPEADFKPHSSDGLVAILSRIAIIGNHGVDIFFVISGFLMIRVYGEFSGAAHAGRFLLGRVLRIYPAFLVAYVLCTIGAIHFFGALWVWRDFLAGLIFLNADYSITMVRYLHVSWSLAYEFAFYLVLPFVLIVGQKRYKLAVVVAATLLVALFSPSTVIRFTGLFLGAAVGVMTDDRIRAWMGRTPWILVLAAYAGVFFVGGPFSAQFQGSDGSIRAGYFACMLAITLLFMKIVWSDGWPNRMLSTASAKFLGNISYSFYLWHSFVLGFVHVVVIPRLQLSNNLVLNMVVYAGLSLPLAIAIAYASFCFIERPYFTWKHRAQSNP